MSDIQKLEGLHNQTGQWVEIDSWDFTTAEYDALGWIYTFGLSVGHGCARLPSGAAIDLSAFSIIRQKEQTE